MACGNNNISRDYLKSEPIQRLLTVTAMDIVDSKFAPNQPETVVIQRGGRDHEMPAWQIRERPDGTMETLKDRDSLYSSAPLHVHTIMHPDGSVQMVATDRRNGGVDHFARLDLPDATDEQMDAFEEFFVHLLNDREA